VRPYGGFPVGYATVSPSMAVKNRPAPTRILVLPGPPVSFASRPLDQPGEYARPNPYNYRQEYGISAFDIKQNVVFCYNYELPFEKLFHTRSRLVQGWAVSGITRFATGLPVTFASYVVPGNLQINHNPRNGQPYFNTSLFTPNALGTPGNSSRRPFYGPGMDNDDLAVHKITKFTESRTLEIRFETFNAFNHAQFFGGSSVDGNISSATFGYVTHAAPPRISQVAAKFTF
jgi:hypothetical protein